MISELYQEYLKSKGVETDTRKPLEEKIFFALKGDNFDGNAYAQKALESGAKLAVIDEPQYQTTGTLLVEDSLQTLQQLGLYHRQQLGIPVIAITGSNGKTTTKELMHAVLSSRLKTSATKGNLNNHIGVPLTLLSISPDTEVAIVEMGANHQGEIASYCSYTAPDYGLITNIGKAHIEGFGSVEGIKKGKGELYDYLRSHDGTVYVHADDETLMEMADGIKKHTYGCSSSAELQGEILPPSDAYLHLKVQGITIDSQLTGSYNAANILAALCVGRNMGVPMDLCAEAIADYTPDNSRSQMLHKKNYTIVLDAYNANPTSMALALQNFSAMVGTPKIAMIGSMKELGDQTPTEHQAIIDLAKSLDIDYIVLVGTEYRDLETAGTSWYADSTAARDFISSLDPDTDYHMLIKGSRSTKMEEILNEI